MWTEWQPSELRPQNVGHITGPLALPAELQAQIGTFYAEKVAKFGFLEYSIFREKTNKSDWKTGGGKSGRMWLAMDANRTLSQTELRAQINSSKSGTEE